MDSLDSRHPRQKFDLRQIFQTLTTHATHPKISIHVIILFWTMPKLYEPTPSIDPRNHATHATHAI